MDNEWKLKMALGKVPVVPLHHANDFTTWQLAIRRLVTTYNMADALLYSVPSTRARLQLLPPQWQHHASNLSRNRAMHR